MDILCVYMYMCKCCYKRKFLKAVGFNNIAGIYNYMYMIV